MLEINTQLKYKMAKANISFFFIIRLQTAYKNKKSGKRRYHKLFLIRSYIIF
jgi:hypothetical protein